MEFVAPLQKIYTWITTSGSDLWPIECKNLGVLYTLQRIKIWVNLCNGEQKARGRNQRISSQTSEIRQISCSYPAFEQIGNLNKNVSTCTVYVTEISPLVELACTILSKARVGDKDTSTEGKWCANFYTGVISFVCLLSCSVKHESHKK